MKENEDLSFFGRMLFAHPELKKENIFVVVGHYLLLSGTTNNIAKDPLLMGACIKSYIRRQAHLEVSVENIEQLVKILKEP